MKKSNLSILDYIFKALMIISLTLSSTVSVNASETKKDYYIYDVEQPTEQEINNYIKNYLEEKYDIDNLVFVSANKSTRAHVWYEEELISTLTNRTYDVGVADGQPRNGVIFEGTTGNIYWEDGGSDISFGVSVGGQMVSFDLSVGYKSSGVTGYSLTCPANTACLLATKKKVDVQVYDVTAYTDSGPYYNETVAVPILKQLIFYNDLG